MLRKPIPLERWIVSILLTLLAIGLGFLAWGTLSNLWTGHGDSPDSTYLWTGLPLAALALAAAARLASLAGGSMHGPLMVVTVASLVVALVAGLIGVVVVDESLWISIATTLLLAVLFLGSDIANRLKLPSTGTRSAIH